VLSWQLEFHEDVPVIESLINNFILVIKSMDDENSKFTLPAGKLRKKMAAKILSVYQN